MFEDEVGEWAFGGGVAGRLGDPLDGGVLVATGARLEIGEARRGEDFGNGCSSVMSRPYGTAVTWRFHVVSSVASRQVGWPSSHR